MEYKFRSLRSWQKSRYTRLSNCSPLSDTNDLGMPKRQKIFFQMNRVTSLSLIDAKASAFIHLLKLSVTTNNSFFNAGAVGNGPKISIPYCENGHGLEMETRSYAGDLKMGDICWQGSHFLV